jgi:nucleotide-binding universal stress UspA family protein
MTAVRTRVADAVLVGVDGSASNRAAVEWAAREAEAADRPLALVAVLDDVAFLAPSVTSDVDCVRARQVLGEIAAATRRAHPQLRVTHEMQVGGTVTTLLDQTVDRSTLVVGKRGLGAFGRMMLGSTSTGLAGRSRIPVVVVPDAWAADAHTGEPLVVGVDPGQELDRPLRWALARARRLGVPLHVVHSTDLSRAVVWDPQVEVMVDRDWMRRRSEDVRAGLELARADFPGVDVLLVEDPEHPVDLLLRRAAGAQMVVLGRRPPATFGLTLGSVARGVLHHATVPVAVIPS